MFDMRRIGRKLFVVMVSAVTVNNNKTGVFEVCETVNGGVYD